MSAQTNKRADRVRFKLRSSAKKSAGSGRMRLSIFKSLRHIHVQAIDDTKRITVASATTNCKAFDVKKATRAQQAEWAGKAIAKRLLEKKIKAVYLDRGPYAYHGTIKVFADAARSTGLDF